MQYTDLQSKLREKDDVRIVRQWVESPVIYDPLDSRIRTRNPNYHPPIFQTETGVYVDGNGNRLPKNKVPAHILEEGTPPDGTPVMGSKRVSLAEAMIDAQTPADVKPQVSPPTPPRRRGRPKGSKNKTKET